MRRIKLITVLLAVFFALTGSVRAQEKAARPPAQFNDAVYLSQYTPGSMNAGESYGISVTMKNTGQNIWRQGNYSLKLINVSESVAKTWNISSVDVSSAVNPGESVVFNFSVTAPQTDGSYNMQWQMAAGNSFFGEPSMNVPIRVMGPGTIQVPDLINNNAQFISQKVDSEMDEGQTYDLTVIMKNTGTTTWKPGEYKLKVSTKGGDNLGAWTVANVELSDDVNPGSEVIFKFKVTAPEKSGVYNLQCQVVKDGAFFGEPTTNVIVNVD